MGIVYKENLIRPSSPFSLFSVPSPLPAYLYIPSCTFPLPINPSKQNDFRLLIQAEPKALDIVSVIPSEYATCPFSSNSSALLTALVHQHDWWLSGHNFSLFKFRLLTSQDSHTHSLSHGNLITPLTPTVLLPPYDLHIKMNMNKNRTRLITSQSCLKTTTTN